MGKEGQYLRKTTWQRVSSLGQICQKSTTEIKRALILYAHKSSRSFNVTAKDKAKETLEEQGCTVKVSDLYAMKFKGTAHMAD